MMLKDIIDKINEVKPYIKNKYKANIIGIFGSFARNNYNENSDIDVLVVFDKNASLFDLIGLSLYLEDLLGRKVDVVPKNSLREEIKEKILSEMITFWLIDY